MGVLAIDHLLARGVNPIKVISGWQLNIALTAIVYIGHSRGLWNVVAKI